MTSPPPIILTRHARDRMRQRGVTAQDVEVTLYHPDAYLITPQASVRYTRTMTNGRTLKVWTNPPPNPPQFVVRSVAWKGEDDASGAH